MPDPLPVTRRSGRLDVLVNNAGISGGRMPVTDVTAADLSRVYDCFDRLGVAAW